MLSYYHKYIVSKRKIIYNISKACMKNVYFHFFRGQHLTNLHEILISGFHGDHYQKMVVLWKFYNKSGKMEVKLMISVTSRFSPSA